MRSLEADGKEPHSSGNIYNICVPYRPEILPFKDKKNLRVPTRPFEHEHGRRPLANDKVYYVVMSDE